MLRTIQIHPISLLAGVGFALLGVVAMAQMPAAKRPAAEHDSGLLQVAHPRDWVVIKEGVPFTVPTAKRLVLTALGSNAVQPSGFDAYLRINGTAEAAAHLCQGNSGSVPSSSNIMALPVGLAVGDGSVVEVSSDYASVPGDARAWGYLVDA